MYTEYAYIKLRYLRWAVTPNDQSLVYVNVIQNGRLEHVPDCVSKQSSLVKDLRLLQMIRYNILNHFAKSWRLSFTEMHGEKVDWVSCFVQ